MALSRNEELIFRELEAMAGDVKQVAENIIRDHEERVKEAEERAGKLREATPDSSMPVIAIRGFDRLGLIKDLAFIQGRLHLLIEYVIPEAYAPSDPGRRPLPSKGFFITAEVRNGEPIAQRAGYL